MSNNQQKKKKETKDSVKLQNVPQFQEATLVVLQQNVEDKFLKQFTDNMVKQNKILNSFQLKQELILSYLKELTFNQIVQKNQVLSYTLCGQLHNFLINEVQPEIEGVMVTKRTIFKLMAFIAPETELIQKQPKKLFGLDKQTNTINQLIEQSIGSQSVKMIEAGFQTIKVQNLNQLIINQGILLIGPSGSGKSEILKQISKQHYRNCTNIKINQSFDTHREILQALEKCQTSKEPQLILIDDLQNIGSKDDSLLAVKVLLNAFDTIEQSDQRIILIATLQNIKQIDERLRRSGRFEKEVNLDMPKYEERCDILKQLIQGKNVFHSQNYIN